jgi:hypothetical protein
MGQAVGIAILGGGVCFIAFLIYTFVAGLAADSAMKKREAAARREGILPTIDRERTVGELLLGPATQWPDDPCHRCQSLHPNEWVSPSDAAFEAYEGTGFDAGPYAKADALFEAKQETAAAIWSEVYELYGFTICPDCLTGPERTQISMADATD